MFPRFWRKVFINSFILSNFNYCTLVWSISSANSFLKTGHLQQQALRVLQDDYSNSYEEYLKSQEKVLLMFATIAFCVMKS